MALRQNRSKRTAPSIEDVFARHRVPVYRLCYSLLGNRQDAEDAVQLTFERLLGSGVTFNDERHERAWLITVAKRVCLDESRRAYRTRERVGLSERQEVEATSGEEPAAGEALLAILAPLSGQERACAFLRYHEGMSSGEIGALLGVSPSTVRTYLQRARQSAQRVVGGSDG